MVDMDEDYEQWASDKIQSLVNENYQLRALLAKVTSELAAANAEVQKMERLNSSYKNLTTAQECQLTKLRERLYELRNADKTLDSEIHANHLLTEQLTLAELSNKKLRECLDWAEENLNCEPFEWSNEEDVDMHQAVKQALSEPCTTEHLREWMMGQLEATSVISVNRVYWEGDELMAELKNALYALVSSSEELMSMSEAKTKKKGE